MFEVQVNPNIYVWMLSDGLHLFVPQDDVQSVEIISDIDESETPIGAVGWWQDPSYEQSSPIFCLTKDLHLSQKLKEAQEYFVLLKDRDVPVGITCEKVEHLDIVEEHLDFQILPPVMKTAESPISQLLIYKNKLACVCLGADLIDYLAKQSTLFEHKKRHG
jgi:hypothetical protein